MKGDFFYPIISFEMKQVQSIRAGIVGTMGNHSASVFASILSVFIFVSVILFVFNRNHALYTDWQSRMASHAFFFLIL
jgi:hypothetical protein